MYPPTRTHPSPTGLPTPINWRRPIRSFLPRWRTTLLEWGPRVVFPLHFLQSFGWGRHHSIDRPILRLLHSPCILLRPLLCEASHTLASAHKFSAQGKIVRIVRTSGMPGTTLPISIAGCLSPHNVQDQYACSVFKPLWILAIQAKLYQFRLDVRR